MSGITVPSYNGSEEDLNEIGKFIANDLSVNIEDFGIGSYEYWGSCGTDVNIGAVIDDASFVVRFEDPENIPVLIRGTTTHGGCSGEHHGRCNSGCDEFEVSFSATLSSVSRKDKDGKKIWVAEYDIEQD